MQEEETNFLKKKIEAKRDLAKKFSFSAKKPLLGVFLDHELSKKDEEKIKSVLEGTANIDVEVIVLSESNLDISSLPHTIFLPYGRINRQTLLDAVDIAISFPFNDVEEMLLHGVIPVCKHRPEVKNYNPNHETGNGFIYRGESAWSIFAALVRALETFKFPYDWKHIVRHGMESVKSF
ncbi:MAG: hypothetical protein WC873_01635 [Candidatus Gracilibacteria bacterium]